MQITGEISVDIRTAEEQDISDVLHLIGECTKDMESQGIYQWGEFYPTIDLITEDIQNKSVYF